MFRDKDEFKFGLLIGAITIIAIEIAFYLVYLFFYLIYKIFT
jgi:hypothetical protein